MPTSKFMVAVHKHHWWAIGLGVPFVSVSIDLFLMFGQIAEKRANDKADVNPVATFAACVALGAMLSGCVKLFLDRAKEEADKEEKKEEKEAERLKEEEEQQEVIGATAGFASAGAGGQLAITARLLNAGACKVNIASVVLVLVEAGKRVGYQMYRHGPMEVHKAANVTFRSPSQHPDATLEPKDAVVFIIEHAGVHSLRKVPTMKPEEVWILVRSTIGNVAVIPGQEIQEAISRTLGQPPQP